MRTQKHDPRVWWAWLLGSAEVMEQNHLSNGNGADLEQDEDIGEMEEVVMSGKCVSVPASYCSLAADMEDVVEDSDGEGETDSSRDSPSVPLRDDAVVTFAQHKGGH